MDKFKALAKQTLEFNIDANMNISHSDIKDMNSITQKTTEGSTFTIDDGVRGLSTGSSGNMGMNDEFYYNGDMSCWNYWERHYYPQVIKTEYPVYIQERSKDKGKKALEIIKILKDKKLIKLDKVKDFIDAMDTLINIL